MNAEERTADTSSHLVPGWHETSVRRRPAEVPAPALEADYAPPTGSQGAAIADALRLLAMWAVRAARQGPESAADPSPAANNPLDFPRAQSDECEAIPRHEER